MTTKITTKKQIALMYALIKQVSFVGVWSGYRAVIVVVYT